MQAALALPNTLSLPPVSTRKICYSAVMKNTLLWPLLLSACSPVIAPSGPTVDAADGATDAGLPLVDSAVADHRGDDTAVTDIGFLDAAQDAALLPDSGITDATLADLPITDLTSADLAADDAHPDAALPDTAIGDADTSCDLTDPICAAQSRYPGTYGLQDQDLLAALETLISTNRTVDYDDESKDQLYGRGTGVGLDAVDGGIYCLYTGQVLADNYNCEHSWPRSDFAEHVPMLGDLHHLFAVDEMANSQRSNLHFGEVVGDSPSDWTWPSSCACDDARLKTCCSVRGPAVDSRTETAFEPRDDAKGDIARALFYFATRYRSRDINLSRLDGVGPAPSNHIPIYEEQALRRWNISDPVSDKERLRQDRIEAIQGNRNPFVDVPEFVDQINDF